VAAAARDRSRTTSPTVQARDGQDGRINTRPTRRRSTQQQDQQIDELAEKLKELARRQEQEIERQRRMAAGQSGRQFRRRLAARACRTG
jgi:hypothetical protein